MKGAPLHCVDEMLSCPRLSGGPKSGCTSPPSRMLDEGGLQQRRGVKGGSGGEIVTGERGGSQVRWLATLVDVGETLDMYP
jgi:hypothetical protein